MSEGQRVRLAQFIVKNCLLVVVSTPDLDSAYRIFSILNCRGLDLSHSDILKSEVIGRIPMKEQEAYTEKWEDAEEELGREAFSDLFGHTRTIFRKTKAKESILKEFREYVIKSVGDSRKLIDDILIPFADAFTTIQTAGYESTAGAEQVNEMLKWLSRIDNIDWIPPAIIFMARNKSDAKALHRFFVGLERLAAFLMICRYGINDRIERYAKLLGDIQNESDLYAADSPLQLTEPERHLFVKELNGDIYEQVPKRRLYILLRLDSALSDGSATYDHGVISIEHVLPQNPPATSKWCEWFPTQDERDRWVHRLGNLLLLNQKQTAVPVTMISKRKNAYFKKSGVSPFPLTTQAIGESEWSLKVVEQRQMSLLNKLKEVWGINVDIPPDDPPVEDAVDKGEADTSDDSGCANQSLSAHWSGYWYVNVGEGGSRNWDDFRKYGFLCAGWGIQWSDPLKKLKVGDKVFAYRKAAGYVGFGEVIKEAVMAKDFIIDGDTPLLDVPLTQEGTKHNSEDPDLCEWCVGVKWCKAFSREEARKFPGVFTNPCIVCKLRDQKTLDFLMKEFGVEANG